MRRFAAAALTALSIGLSAPAFAGTACVDEPQQVSRVERGLALAQATADALDASGAQVVLLARAGQDLAKYGLRWSHLGFAYRSDGGWRVLHKLNHCGAADSAVYRQGLAEFFLDTPHRYEAAYAVLAPELQAKLLSLVADNRRVTQLDEPRYSMVAYAWGLAYQQSNQWALETLALAEAGADDRARAQAWLQFQRYAPAPLRIDAMTRLGARITRANIAFDDHPNEKRFADRIETVTADSIFDWLPRAGLGSAPVTIP